MNFTVAPGLWARALVTSTALLAAIACGSDKRTPSSGGAAGEGGVEASGGATLGSGGTSAGKAAGGAAAGGEMGGASAGGEAGAAGEVDFSQHRLYQHLIEPFQTYDDCLAAQNPDNFINCYHEVDFCPDGSAVLILTDVQEQGTYVVADGLIDASWPVALEAPNNLRFQIVSPKHVVDNIEHWDWLLDEASTTSYCQNSPAEEQ